MPYEKKGDVKAAKQIGFARALQAINGD